MKSDVKLKWIEALRSGKYKQGFRTLMQESEGEASFCCLGVLCDVLGLRKEQLPPDLYVPQNVTEYSYFFGTEKLHTALTPQVCKSVGLDETEQANLIRMNDQQGKTFNDIADWIERNIHASDY
jgi:hypothetical protein